MLIQRIITAIILLILVILGIFYLPILWFRILAALLLALAAWEFTALIWVGNWFKRIAFMILFGVLLGVAQLVTAKPILIVAVCWWLLAPIFLLQYSRQQQPLFTDQLSSWLVGLVLFVPSFVGIVELKQSFGSSYLLYVLCIVWAADTGAYFAGKYFGKKPLAAALSPKKTVEGVYGGIALAMLVAIIGGVFLHITGIRWLYLLTLVLVTVLWSIIGDLFKSLLKRQAKVKDSGQILPGHGGVFDRIDSLTAAIPIFTLGLILIGF